MRDEIPKGSRESPLQVGVCNVCRIGKKCAVTELGEGWFCAHGTDRNFPPDQEREEAPGGAIGIDRTQARIYYRSGNNDEKTEAIVVSPDDTPFRPSASGNRNGHAKSFDQHGYPVAQVRLLYALKTNSYDDRMRALEQLDTSFWRTWIAREEGYEEWEGITFGQIFKEIQDAALYEARFEEILGYLLVEAAKTKDALANWKLWDDVAAKAVIVAAERNRHHTGLSQPDANVRFIMAVKECAIQHRGLPAQKHVREHWENMGNAGDWKQHRDKLGFAWLPSQLEWKRNWHNSLDLQLQKRAQEERGDVFKRTGTPPPVS